VASRGSAPISSTTSSPLSPEPLTTSPPAKRNTRVYGRRIGRPLRKARQELIDELLPQLRVVVEDGKTLDVAALFPGVRSVWLELGFGGGEHLAWQAAHHPDVGILGCELFINGVASLLRHVRDQDLAHVRIADTDSFRVLSALPAQSIDRVFLLFPDPWPKARHHRRRFVRRDVLDLLAKVLRDGAEFRFATDHSEYCTWALARVLRHGSFAWTAERPGDWRERPADWPPTRYEERAIAAGRSPVFLTFRRLPRA
jgi:tRNA (guanine-N7-)-methyltransferase